MSILFFWITTPLEFTSSARNGTLEVPEHFLKVNQGYKEAVPQHTDGDTGVGECIATPH
jgi:hypothetical protein